jgi:DNA-binding beta-propeller fold protein YncE
MSSPPARQLLLVCALVACDRSVVFPKGNGAFTRADRPWSHQERVVLTDSLDDTLAFVTSEARPRLLGRLPVGDDPVDIEGPHDLKASPSGDTLYVVLSNYAPDSGSGPHGAHGLGDVPGSLLRLDARTLERTGETILEPNTGELLLDDAGTTAYVSHFDQIRLQRQIQEGLPEKAGWSSVAVIEVATMQRTASIPVCPTTHDLEMSADEKTLYVTCAESDELALVDVATHAVERLPVGPSPGTPLAAAYYPFAALRADADDSVWISCNRSGELRVFDAHAHAMDPARTMRLVGVPMFGAFLSDGKTLLMAQQGVDRVSFIDTATSTEETALALPRQTCLNARNVELSSDEATAFVVCEGDHKTRPGSVVTVDVASRAVVGWVDVGLFPTAVTVAPPAP